MKRTKSVRVSGGNLPHGFSAVIALTVDYTGTTEEERLSWCTANRAIAWQRPARDKLSPDFLRELAKTGHTVHARDCGKALLSREERIAQLEAAGIPTALAELMIDNPEQATKLMGDIDIPAE